MNEGLFWYIVGMLLSFLVGLAAGVAGKRLRKKVSSRKAVIATTFFLCLTSSALSALPVNLALAEESGIRLPTYELYAPAKVVVSFAYTKNVTIEVSTLKTSLYKAITSPVQLEFDAEDVDLYTVTMKILYSGIKVDQTIVIGIFEGNRPVKSIEFDVCSSSITIMMRLSIVKAPTYPTAEEISNLIWDKWRNELITFESKQNDLVTQISNTVVTVGSLAAIAFAVCIALIIVVFHMHQRVAELSEWGIRHRAEHRGEGG